MPGDYQAPNFRGLIESALLAARAQFATTPSFHIVLATLIKRQAKKAGHRDYRIAGGFSRLDGEAGCSVRAKALRHADLVTGAPRCLLACQSASSWAGEAVGSIRCSLVGFAVLIPVTLIYNSYGF
jgi:hypothetical protein